MPFSRRKRVSGEPSEREIFVYVLDEVQPPAFLCDSSTCHFNLAGTGGLMQPPSGFPRITRERIGRLSRNLVYLTIEQFYIFPENFKSVPTMTFDL